MKPLNFLNPLTCVSSMLIIGLALGAPMTVPIAAVAHVGHGDEFQSKGGIQRVKLNAENDKMLGIVVTPIAAGPDVMIPVTAMVEADGQKLVFVQYDKFYEPVPITTGATKGELIAVTQGLSAGEKLVTQGSLSLYAESRKTQSSPAASASPAAPQTAAEAQHAQAHTQGAEHSHDGEFPIKKVAAIAGGLVLLGGGAFAVLNWQKKKGTSEN
ncbi:MAG: cobalt transporter [Alkalinema sp. FL-bin-369]|nr:cobalt transporter [Leptolyngbyaceae cyanobacterium LF-bin-369]